ncbi:hypothetical protein [Marivirga sp.]|uniref:hypothetical protein n=1 Tax=Marivirga sp. TaxID=2018662 RepID=UPI002D7FB4B9|nr:hypothetical protein [Marivirga sp.]HET8858506.1 hypothetical protein [Marivirga sp.]
MKKYRLLIALSLFVGTISAQGVDNERMNKDLKVAQTVLNSLVNENNAMHWNYEREQQTQYIEDYGVILTLPKSNVFAFNFGPTAPPMPDISAAIAKGFGVIEEIQLDEYEEELDEEDKTEIVEIREVRRQELVERQAELEKRAAIAIARAQSKIQDMDSMREQNSVKRTENVIDFLLDYGHLISQLNPSDKILVMEKGHDIRYFRDAGRVERLKTNRLSVEANVKDILAFQEGKIDREEAKSRIVVNTEKEEIPLQKDLTLLNTILKRLYAQDLSETYYLNGGMPTEQIEGLGVIFYMDMVSSIRNGNESWNIPTQNKENLNQAERDDLIKNIYPKFEEELKKNIIEYGKNVSSLAENEQLIFKVGITKCEGCKIPETLELQIKSKTLKDLKSGKLTDKEALNEIKVVKGNLQ